MTKEDTNERKLLVRRSDIIWRTVMTSFAIIVTINMAVVGWLVNRVSIAHQRITDLHIQLVQIPTEIPPPWFVSEVAEIRLKQKEILARLRAVENGKR